MHKMGKSFAVAAMVGALTLVGATSASASESRSGTLVCSGYYPTSGLRTTTTGYVIHDWMNNGNGESHSLGWPSDGFHSSSGYSNVSSSWIAAASSSIISAAGFCA